MLPGDWGGREAQRLTELCMATYGWTCHLCKQPIRQGEQSADHLLPRKWGGSNDLSNLRPAHRKCNYARGAKLLSDPRARPTDNTAFFK
ncbi:HNH endonuclease [Arthrobacter phage Laila]|nr:HNH endonuclease [Arthrobacter phage Elkhorn]ASR83560.1 HNH endonuclease [Arthrobacter phage KylieMac]ASR83708.1 HNH endonuclease [Arthrobacter phage Lore]ASR84006.1 HNH endonuclease [Arthrobacter phage Swenson]QBP30112.1 HNH endonuclease [Arthrobacter phage Blair]QBP30798.1 HNH endonuclease [Arthrobacter phage StewieGriff]QDB74352.1 HNH endonuclease [Arthrobacter phage Laila]